MTDANRRTSINLDVETAEIAKRLGNRSEFVRECLRRWNAWDTNTHVHPTPKQPSKKCYPRSKRGCCIICWPAGPPHHHDWMYYVETGSGGQPFANDWVEEKAREANNAPAFPIPQERGFKKSREEASKQGVLAHLWEKLRLKLK